MNKTALLLLFFCCSLNNLNAQYSLVDTYFDGSKFLSITTNGYLLESTDGINWNENSFVAGSWTDIGYNNSNVHVIVGANNAYFKLGSNSWQASSAVPSGNWTSVIYDSGNNLFVAVATSGSNYVMTSPDGNTWTARTAASTLPHNDLAYADIGGTSRSVAVCQYGRGWIASDPTSAWSQINPGKLNDIRAITYGDGKFIWLEYDEYGNSGNRYRGMSTNGTSFSAATVAVRNKWSSMTYGAGKYVAVAEDSHSSYPNNRAAYSIDGDNWSYTNVVESNSWKSVAYGNSVFVAVSNTGTNRIMHSTDGITWSHSINVITSNSTPTNISLTSSSVNENVAIGTTIGALSTTDPDSGDTHTYTLVSGTGDTDNASFTISGANILTNTDLDYETKNSYSIRVRTTDAGGLTYEEAFTITVNDIDE
ncbi:MAG: cadherin repeat domain-containing protein, partial [Flavobacteriales bacterium]